MLPRAGQSRERCRLRRTAPGCLPFAAAHFSCDAPREGAADPPAGAVPHACGSRLHSAVRAPARPTQRARRPPASAPDAVLRCASLAFSPRAGGQSGRRHVRESAASDAARRCLRPLAAALAGPSPPRRPPRRAGSLCAPPPPRSAASPWRPPPVRTPAVPVSATPLASRPGPSPSAIRHPPSASAARRGARAGNAEMLAAGCVRPSHALRSVSGPAPRRRRGARRALVRPFSTRSRPDGGCGLYNCECPVARVRSQHLRLDPPSEPRAVQSSIAAPPRPRLCPPLLSSPAPSSLPPSALISASISASLLVSARRGREPELASPSLATPTAMCQYKLQIFACGDSYITREKPCANGYPAHCNTFEVPLETRHAVDCYPCRRNPMRRILPAMARGIYAPR